MSRSEGLVQRRNVAQSCVSTTSDPDNDNQINDTEEADLDSKETRLTLMEEILLLGLKDREVGIALLPVHIILCYRCKYIRSHTVVFVTKLAAYLRMTAHAIDE